MRYLTILAFLFALNTQAQTLIWNDDNFSIIYPANWDTMHYSSTPTILSPSDGADDTFRENVNILNEPAKGANDMPIEEYVDINVSYVKDKIGDDAKINISDIAVGHYKDPGKLIDYTTDKLTESGTALHLWQVMVKTNTKYYIFTYTALPDKFEKYLPQVKEMLGSLRFK